jgi:hypothetical protein
MIKPEFKATRCNKKRKGQRVTTGLLRVCPL